MFDIEAAEAHFLVVPCGTILRISIMTVTRSGGLALLLAGSATLAACASLSDE